MESSTRRQKLEEYTCSEDEFNKEGKRERNNSDLEMWHPENLKKTKTSFVVTSVSNRTMKFCENWSGNVTLEHLACCLCQKHFFNRRDNDNRSLAFRIYLQSRDQWIYSLSEREHVQKSENGCNICFGDVQLQEIMRFDSFPVLKFEIEYKKPCNWICVEIKNL